MMKKILARILVAIMLICAAAFTLSACGPDDTKQPDSPPEQSTENGDDNKDDGSGEDSNDDESGLWTPPVKQ